MGNCGSAKKTVKADATKAAQSAVTLAKNENVNPNIIPNTVQTVIKPDALALQAEQAQKVINSAMNGIPKKPNHFIIKFVAVDDSYYPNKNPLNKESQTLSNVNILAKKFAIDTIVKDCLESVINDPSKSLKFFSVAKYKNLDLLEKMNLKLSEIIKEGDESTEHVISLFYTGLRNMPEKVNEFIAKNTNYYGAINYQSEINKELVVFVKDVLSPDYIKLSKVYSDAFDAELNEIINEHTTYCNGLNSFFVSGCGDKGLSKNFIKINLDPSVNKNNNLIQTLAEMPVALQLHAMIFVPDNYIFIVGGFSDLENASNKVYYYDINANSWDQHSQMNHGRVQHSLCLVNDQYLYAIFGNKNNKKDDVKNMERISLRGAERLWEPIFFDTFDLQFFNIYGVSQYKNSLILLSVDEKMDTVEIEDNNERNLIFNLKTNTLSLYSPDNIRMLSENKALPMITHSKKPIIEEENLDHRLEFLERSFIPVSHNILILSPFNHNKNKSNLIIIKDGLAKNESFIHI